MNKKFLRNIAIYSLIVIIAAYLLPEKLDWSDSYSRDHDSPYGAELLNSELTSLFPDVEIETLDQPIYNVSEDFVDNGALLVYINQYVRFDSLDLKSILSTVEEGNQVLIAAEQISGLLLDTLNILQEYEYGVNQFFTSGTFNDTTTFHLFNHQESRDTGYHFYMDQYTSYFVTEDTLSLAYGLGYKDDVEKINFLKVPFGKGAFFLHSKPRIFTNYYLVQPGGQAYLEQVFSHMEGRKIYWDEYYKVVNEAKRSSRSNREVIAKQPPLKWAWNVTMASVVLFLLFMSKRRQKAIPEMDPYRNDSKALVETLGDLYFHQSKNVTMMRKKFKLLDQHLFRKYGITREYKVEEIKRILIDRSFISSKFINDTIDLIELNKKKQSISDRTLADLNKRINKIIND